MVRFALRLFAIVLLAISTVAAMADNLPLLVTPADLATYASTNPVRIVDFRGAPIRYRIGHIPGAIYLPKDTVYDKIDGVDGRLPPPARVIEDLEQAGIGTDIPIVIYDVDDGLWASRLFWALEYLGHESVHILAGGFRAWRDSGYKISRRRVRLPPAEFDLQVRPDRYASTEWMLSLVEQNDNSFRIVDARSADEYSGAESMSKRKGHIPEAIHVEWKEHLEDGDGTPFRSLVELQSRYLDDGIDMSKPIVAYCQTGVRAAHSYFTLRLLGYSNVRLYDDSWEVWGNRQDTRIDHQ